MFLENEIIEDVEDSVFDALTNLDISIVRCSAHTLNLAVQDVLKMPNVKDKIELIRSKIKKLRTPSFKNIISLHKMSLPTIDVPTRWNSTYMMVDSLCKHKSFYTTLLESNEMVQIPPVEWQFLEDFLNGFKPVFVATKECQEQDIIIGDFLKVWLKCQMKLENEKSTNIYAAYLFESLGKRKEMIFGNIAFVAGIYMDPRFNFNGSTFLTEEQKTNARVSICLSTIMNLLFKIV